MAKIKELREKRNKLVEEARAIHAKAEAEKRSMTADENANFDRIMNDSDAAKREADALEAEENRSRRLGDAEAELRQSAGRRTEPTTPNPGRGAGNDPAGEDEDPEARHARTPVRFEIRGRRGKDELVAVAGSAVHRRHSPRRLAEFRSYLRGEQRNLQTDLDVSGGYLVAPEQMVAGLLKTVDDEVHIRRLATVHTVTDAVSLGVVTRTNKASTFARGAELAAPTDDTSLKFGKRQLTPSYLTGSIRVSRDLLRAAVMSPESIVNDELARDAGEVLEQEYMTGSGAGGEALGVFTASDDGVPTSRDVATGNLATSITFDGLISAKMSLKQRYRNRSTWLFHRDAVTQIMKLKDGNGQYLWQRGTADGSPETILERPYIESEWAPSTFTSGLYVGAIADWSYYWIADQLMMEIQRLVEKYAETNQIGFICRLKNDAAPMLSEAFARVKLG